MRSCGEGDRELIVKAAAADFSIIHLVTMYMAQKKPDKPFRQRVPNDIGEQNGKY